MNQGRNCINGKNSNPLTLLLNEFLVFEFIMLDFEIWVECDWVLSSWDAWDECEVCISLILGLEKVWTSLGLNWLKEIARCDFRVLLGCN